MIEVDFNPSKSFILSSFKTALYNVTWKKCTVEKINVTVLNFGYQPHVNII